MMFLVATAATEYIFGNDWTRTEFYSFAFLKLALVRPTLYTIQAHHIILSENVLFAREQKSRDTKTRKPPGEKAEHTFSFLKLCT